MAEAKATVREIDEGTLLYIEVQPGSGHPGRLCYDEWRKRIRISVGARAEGGRANQEVVERLAGLLGVPANKVRIASGQTDRRKTVIVAGVRADKVLGILAGHFQEA